MAELPTFEEIWRALINIPEFPSSDYMKRLHNKVRSLRVVSRVFNVSGFPQPNPDPDFSNTIIDGVNQEPILKTMAYFQVNSVLSSLDGEKDAANFRQYVKKNATEEEDVAAMDMITALFFAEHVSKELLDAGLPALRDFPIGGDYAKQFRDTLMSDQIIKVLMFGESLRGGTATLALLFMCDYLENGPGFTPWIGDAFEKAPSRQVLVSWTALLLNTPGLTVPEVFSFATRVSSAVTVPANAAGKAVLPSAETLKPSTKKLVMVQALDEAKAQRQNGSITAANLRRRLPVLDATEDDLEETAVETFESAASINMVVWESTVRDKWVSPVSSEATEQTQSQETITQSAGAGQYSPGFSSAFMPRYLSITTVTGQEVAEWLKPVSKEFPNLFTDRKPKTSHNVLRRLPNPLVPSCFVAGTKVATAQGEVNIENITEGMRILTNASTRAYGIASDEKVESVPGKVMLAGFNKEGVFFTPGHVFHTTSGLRAIDPAMAEQENAWVNVGKLREGHAVYRLGSDGKSYQVVTIKSIQLEEGPVQSVYGVHLREGERRYHADGYLVAVNYPEITLKSVAGALMQLPAGVRNEMLLKVKELGPVFSNLGVNGFSDLLQRELGAFRKDVGKVGSADEDLAQLKAANRRTAGYRGVNFADMHRTYALSACDSAKGTKDTPAGYRLPVLTVYEGILLADGQVVRQATLDVGTAEIRWTRPLKGEGSPCRYEHGCMRIFEQSKGMAGRGAVLLADEANTASPPEDKARVIPFMASKYVAKSASTQGKLAPFGEVDEAQAAAVRRSVPIPSRRTVDVDLELVPIDVGQTEDRIDNEEYWTVHVDSEEWPFDEDGDEPRTDFVGEPLPMGEVGMGLWRSGTTGVDSVTTVAALYKTLDELQERINATRPAGLPAIGQLYSRQSWLDENGNIAHRIVLESAPSLAALSDQARSLSAEERSSDTYFPPSRNLTFTGNFDGWTIDGPALPLLFSHCEFVVSFDFSSVSGVMFEWDPIMRGAVGKRYYFGSHFSSRQQSALLRRSLSRQVATPLAASDDDNNNVNGDGVSEPGSAGVAVPGMAKVEPAPVTSRLAAAAPLSLMTLYNLRGYNDNDIHEATQSLVKKMMLFHMDDSDRQLFFSAAKPVDLPSSLAQRLRGDLKTWLKDIYANAYCGLMVASTDHEREEDLRVKMTQAEKDKVRYFWNGKGSTCLANSQEYDEIVDLATVFAMRQLYQADIVPYLIPPEDPELWAKKLFFAVVDKDLDEEIPDLGQDQTGTDNTPGFLLDQLLNSMLITNGDGTNELNKRCNVILALAPETGRSYAIEMFDHVMAAYIDRLSQSPMNTVGPALTPEDDETPPEEMEWLSGILTLLIEQILDPTSDITQDIRDEILADLNELFEELDIDAAQDAAAVASAVTASITTIVGLAQDYFRLIWTAGKNVLAWAGWASAADKGSDNALNESVKSGETSSTRARLLKGLLAITMMAGIGVMFWQMTLSWDQMTEADRGVVILSMLKGAIDTIDMTVGYQRFKDFDPGNPNRAVVTNRVDRGLSQSNRLRAKTPSLGILPLADLRDQLITEKGMATFVNNMSTEVRDMSDSRDLKGRPFNQPLFEEVDVPDTTRRPKSNVWRNVATRQFAFETVSLGVGLAMGVAMSFSLKNNWNNLDRTARILTVIENVTVHLTTVVEITILVGQSALGFTSSFFTVALPVAGAVLAIAGIIIMIVLAVRGSDNADGEPPLSGIELYIQKLKPILEPFVDQPPPRLTYTAAPAAPNAGSSLAREGFIITAKNNTDQIQALTNFTINLNTGDDPGTCMWVEQDITNAEGAVPSSGVIEIGMRFVPPLDNPEDRFDRITSTPNFFPGQSQGGVIAAVATLVDGGINDFFQEQKLIMDPGQAIEVFYGPATWQEKGFAFVTIDELAEVELDGEQVDDVSVQVIEIERK